MRDVRRIIGGGRGLRGGVGKRVDMVFPGRPQNIRHHRRPVVVVDDCSPGRGGMVQDGGTRGGTSHGEMDRCREKARAGLWHTVSSGFSRSSSSSMSERDRKDQGEDSDSPKQAG